MTELPKPLREVAAELGVSPRWLRELIHKEAIPVLKRGRLIWFDRQAIDLLVEALRSPPAAENPPTPSRYRGRLQDNDFDAVLRLTAPASREKKQRPEAGRKR